VQPETVLAERIAALKRLQSDWSFELEQVVRTDLERAWHQVEALDDLADLIRQLEGTK
jgi:hypothetical protein